MTRVETINFFARMVFGLALAGAGRGDAWETFHGDRGLSGFVAGDFPAEPVIRWRVAVDDGGVSFPCLVDSQAVYGFSDRGRVVAIGFDGRILWSREIGELAGGGDGDGRRSRLAGTGVVVDAGLAFASDRGTVVFVNRASGELLWRRELDVAMRAPLGLARDGDRDLLLAMDQGAGILHALRISDGSSAWQSPDLERSDCPPSSAAGRIVFGSCAAALHVVSAADGRSLGALHLAADCQVAAGTAMDGDRAFAGHRGGGMVKAHVGRQEAIWQTDAVDGGIFSTPAIGGEFVVFGADDGSLTCLKQATGEPVWRLKLKHEPSSPVIVDGKVLTTDTGEIYLVSLKTGEILWQRRLSDEISPLAAGQGMVFVGTDEGEIVALGTPLAE